MDEDLKYRFVETISDKVDIKKSFSRNISRCQQVCDLEDATTLAGNGRYNYLLLFTCSIISNAVALDLFGFGLVVATASCDLNLTMEQKGMLSSVPFAGILFAFPWGYFADTSGRKKALIWSTSVGFIFAALSSFSSHWYMMVALKFIGCSFSTAAFSITMTFLGECTSSQYRGQYLQIMNSINLASEAVSFLLAFIVLPLDFNIPITWLSITYRPWRLLTFLMAVPLGLGAIMMMYLHESPKFLANKGKEAEALEVFKDIYERNGGSKDEYQVKSLVIMHSNKDPSKSTFWSSIIEQTVPLFKPPLLWRTLQMFYLLMIICSTNNVFAIWFPTIVNTFFVSFENGVTGDFSFCDRIVDNITVTGTNVTCEDSISKLTIYSGIAYGIFYTLVNLVIVKLANFRKVVVLATLTVSAISCLMVDLVRQPVANMLFFVLLQSTSLCIGIAASYFVDLFPTSYRALATSLGMMMGRVASFIGVNLIGVIIGRYCNVTFYSWTVFVLSGVILALFLPTDKKSKILY